MMLVIFVKSFTFVNDMATIFSRIVTGEIPCYKLAEDENFFAFLDIHPVTQGHALVIPKKEEDYIFDLDDETLSGLVLFAKKVANKLQNALKTNRIGIVVMGLEVPHAHIHLIPMNSESDLDFRKPKLQLTQNEFIEIQNLILNA